MALRPFIILAAVSLALSVQAQPYEPTFLLDMIGDSGQQLGERILEPIGDQDGDGYDDILVSVGWRNNHLRIIYGGPAAPYRMQDFGYLPTDTTTHQYAWSIPYGHLCADYTGDGQVDIMVCLTNLSEGWQRSRTYLYIGGPGQFDTLWDWHSEFDTARVLGTVGDYDANGHADFVRGWKGGDMHILYYYSGTWPNMSSEPTWIYDRYSSQGNFYTCDGVGDVTGDGHPDFLFVVLNPSRDTLYQAIWFGGPGADSLPDFIFSGEYQTPETGGWRIIGDINGDHVNDLIASTSDSPYGTPRIYYGGGNPLDVTTWDVTLNSPSEWFITDYAINLGDINGDSCEDLAFYVHEGIENQSWNYVYLGGRPMNGQWDLSIGPDFDGFAPGIQISAAGDFNGDGLDDWMFESTDRVPLGGQERGRVTVVAGDPRFGLAVVERPTVNALDFAFGDPYPNPFNSTVTIPLTINGPHPGIVDVAIYNVLGEKVYEWGKVLAMSGKNRLTWDGKTNTGQAVSSGQYFIKAVKGNQVATGKLILAK